jgi:hypothetical protein
MLYSGVEIKEKVSAGIAIVVDKRWKNKIEPYVLWLIKE